MSYHDILSFTVLLCLILSCFLMVIVGLVLAIKTYWQYEKIDSAAPATLIAIGLFALFLATIMVVPPA